MKTKSETVYDLHAFEQEARRLRAEATRNAFRRLAKWLSRSRADLGRGAHRTA